MVCFQCVGVELGPVGRVTGHGRSKWASKYPANPVICPSRMAVSENGHENSVSLGLAVMRLKSAI